MHGRMADSLHIVDEVGVLERVPERDAERVRTTQVRGFGSEARDLIEFSPRLVAYNALYLAFVWIVALGAIALFWIHPAWWTLAVAFAVVSSRQQALLNCEHEAVHRKFFPSRRGNDLVGVYVCAAAVGSPFGAARARHLSHHRLVGAPDDPDRDLYSGDDKRTRGDLVRYFLSGLLGGYAGMVLMGPRAPREAVRAGSPHRDLLSLVAVQAVIAVVLTVSFDWWVYPVLWLAPLASLTALTHLIRSFVEHAIIDSEEPVHSNRLITIKSTRLERALVAPYFMNFHAEHHLLPSVPAPRLPRLRKRLAERGDTPPVLVRRSYGYALRLYSRQLPR